MSVTMTGKSNRVVQGLWIGSALSAMERMSINSFLVNGHEYHLYVYDDVKQVPDGAVIKDGNEILPSSMIFLYRDYASYSGFSNFFRYKLLLDKGGWWADTDLICLKPFDFQEEHVFASEIIHDEVLITSGVIKAPADSRAMQYAWQVCQTKNPQQLVWGETGPKLMAEIVREFSLEAYVKPSTVFCPLSVLDWHQVREPDGDFRFAETTHAIHLWNEAWRRTGYDKNRSYHPDCLYEKLKRKYLD
jgi:mannosyltransferase OCH1-like enzyme